MHHVNIIRLVWSGSNGVRYRWWSCLLLREEDYRGMPTGCSHWWWGPHDMRTTWSNWHFNNVTSSYVNRDAYTTNPQFGRSSCMNYSAWNMYSLWNRVVLLHGSQGSPTWNPVLLGCCPQLWDHHQFWSQHRCPVAWAHALHVCWWHGDLFDILSIDMNFAGLGQDILECVIRSDKIPSKSSIQASSAHISLHQRPIIRPARVDQFRHPWLTKNAFVKNSVMGLGQGLWHQSSSFLQWRQCLLGAPECHTVFCIWRLVPK